MIIRYLIVILILWLPLAGQELPELPQLPELREANGKFQGVVVHRRDVEPGPTLIMKSLKGDIIMQGTDVPRIVIEERIAVRTRDKEWARETIEQAKGELSAAPEKTGVYVFKVGKWSSKDISYRYKVRLPKTFNVIIHSYGGDVDLAELQGDLEIKTGGGDIALSSSGGNIKVGTGGGDIDVFKVEGQVDLSTGGGDIEGRAVEGKIKAHTGGGDIDFWTGKGNFYLNTGGGDIDLQSMEGTVIEARTGGGDITANNITAQLNLLTGGGDICGEDLKGSLEAATSGGDICLTRVSGDVIMFSAAGDVEIHHITGAVRVKSGSGDIEVYEMTLEEPGRKESSITTVNGCVLVHYLAPKPVSIDARILGVSPKYAKEHISSNVDLVYQKENGSTVATYTVESPFHRIVIETSNGDIEIRKGEQ